MNQIHPTVAASLKGSIPAGFLSAPVLQAIDAATKKPARISTDKCNENQMCVHLAKQIVPFEKAGFVKWEKVVNSKLQLCGVAYKKTPSTTPFLITVCPWCGAHPGFEFPLKATGVAA